jgi:predicted nucleic acid-binding protein
MTPVFIDTNIPIYAAGRHHPLKEACTRVMLLVLESPANFVTNVEVLQEVIHHYVGVRNWAQGRLVFDRFAIAMTGRIKPCTASDIRLAALLADHHPNTGGRDLVHAAVMQRLGIDTIVSADRGFDGFAGLRRLDPLDVDRWEPLVVGSPG